MSELDGCFFEKFGSLLKEQAAQAAAQHVEEGEEAAESDFEPEELDKKEIISSAMGWNVSINNLFIYREL